MLSRPQSASPGLWRAVSPLGLSIVQRRAQLAKQTPESALSNIGHVAEETQHIRGVPEVEQAEATSTHSRMENSVALLAVQAEASMVQVVSALSKCMEKMAADTYQARMSRVVEMVADQLDKK